MGYKCAVPDRAAGADMAGGKLEKQIFISYSHQESDKQWLDRLLTALVPLVKRDEIDVWADTDLRPGSDWRKSIEREIGRSNVAVPLVSANFLASAFIAEVELPQILEAAANQELTLAWLPVSASAWEATALSKFQAIIDPRRPLDQMPAAEAQQALVNAAHRIVGARTLTDLSRTMHIVDEAYDGLSEQAGHPPRQEPYRVQARHTGTSLAFEARGAEQPIEEITAEDLANLPEREHRLIQALQASMDNEYERWTTLYARRQVLTAAEREAFDVAGKSMCAELGRILDFIERELHKNLQDHYAGVRYACSDLVAQATNPL